MNDLELLLKYPILRGKRKSGFRTEEMGWVFGLESRDLIEVDSEVHLEVLVCTLLLNQGLPDPFP